MIELKNIKKNYKNQKVTTEVLKGINLKLGERGITFILGKSGSGKSTLLNILGGLDNYTSGDLIINGKSTKTFTEKNWDAYRNTYMGFVFQEYNLLDNYTVEDNIKLAMELQHKKCSNKEISEVLKLVELEGLSKRKTNELSGGQKQRIAIARALIKNPEIILADEPTGNLDKETSRQIFEILKKLSKDKLIVIVSHDEESARKYADRIVRIEDGLIISDDNTEKIENKSKFMLVDAKLPFFYTMKMGLGNLFHKKFRLLFSVLLITLCLICFGTSISCLDFDINDAYLKTFEKNGSTEVYLTKYKSNLDYEKVMINQLKSAFGSDAVVLPETLELNQSFVTEANQKTGLVWNEEYSVTNNFSNLEWTYSSEAGDSAMLYFYIGNTPTAKTIKLVKYNEQLLNDYNLIGTKPVNDDEIVINSFIADQIIYAGIDSKTTKNASTSTVYKPLSYEQIIKDGLYLNFGDMMYVKVTGIVDYSKYLEKYDQLKKTKTATYWDLSNNGDSSFLDKQYNDLIKDGGSFLSRVYVTNDFITKIATKEENVSNSLSKIIYNDKEYLINEFGYINKDIDVYTSSGLIKKNSLNSNEIVINLNTLNAITNGDYENKFEEYLENTENVNQQAFLENYLKSNGIIGKKVKSGINNNKLYYDLINFTEYDIVGVVDDKLDFNFIYYSKEVMSKLITDNLKLERVYTKVDKVTDLQNIIKYYPITNSNVISSSEYSKELIINIGVSALLKLIGKYGTIFFFIFSVIILMNFITNSIKYRKKEIGILRAIGCKRMDILKIFIYEVLMLMIICLVLSFIFIPEIVISVNSGIIRTLNTQVDIMHFGLLQMICVGVIMLVISIFASIMPIKRVTKMKPIDAILDRK